MFLRSDGACLLLQLQGHHGNWGIYVCTIFFMHLSGHVYTCTDSNTNMHIFSSSQLCAHLIVHRLCNGIYKCIVLENINIYYMLLYMCMYIPNIHLICVFRHRHGHPFGLTRLSRRSYRYRPRNLFRPRQHEGHQQFYSRFRAVCFPSRWTLAHFFVFLLALLLIFAVLRLFVICWCSNQFFGMIGKFKIFGN